MNYKSILIIVLFIVLSGVTLAKNIIILDQTSNSVSLKIENNEDIESYIAVVFESGKSFELLNKIDYNGSDMFNLDDVYYLKGHKTNTFMIEGLKPITKYEVVLYSKEISKNEIEKTHFCTKPDKKPTPASNLAYKYNGDSEYSIQFKKGSGNGRIIIASANEIKNLPKNGIKYNSVPFGSKIAQFEGETAFVVYNSEADNSSSNSVDLKILSPDPFWLSVVEFIGNDECIMYCKEYNKGNMRKITPGLDAPVAIDAREFPNGFLARWKPVAGAEKYLIQVAYDQGFNDIIDAYNDIDFGNITEVPVNISDKKSGVVFYRIRAARENVLSNYSNVITVRLK